MTIQTSETAAPNPAKRSVLGLVFLTVFLDIVGFSIIFPLFPDLLDHYLATGGDASWLADLVQTLDGLSGGDKTAVVALFGGLLGSVYGLLQFLFSAVWGGLSDRIGRRPTLLVTLVGTSIGYILWVFAGSFLVLIVARVVGGIMAGNISTASAAVADTTSAKDRAKGMGIVGMAIGLGFIMGPAIGGILASHLLIDPGSPPSGAFALNPFSAPALAALGLSLINLIWVVTRFPETLPKSRRGQPTATRTLNPFKRLARIDLPGVVRTTLVYFFYLVGFAASEFTLTFLAKERFDYTPRQMALIFVFVGFIIALVQGGLVRRLAPKYGERRVGRVGLILTIPGLLLIGAAHSLGVLYGGLAFLAVGSALVMPCFSALISRYTPPDRQGLALGAFRSMGSLSRALGPILGSVAYWRLGSASPYWAAALTILIPIGLAIGLPEPTDPE